MKNRNLAVAASLLVAMLIGWLPSAAQSPEPPPQACDNPTRLIQLFAERIGHHRIGYGLTPDKPTIPGPTLEITEGECLAVQLTNDTDVKLSMHAHGVAYTVRSDGTPLNDSCVAPGRTRTYVFEAHAPRARADGTIDAGNAGYWHYHDHCVGTHHGTGGVKAGLFGAFIVRRAGDPLPDVPTFVTVMGPGSRINLKKSPSTPVFTANEGQRVEFVVIGHGDDFHTFHLHGHRWADTRTGLTTSVNDQTQLVDNRTTGPADSFGFQVIAGEGVGPGAWMYHCHVQGHSDAGMSGIFRVATADGTLPLYVTDAVKRWRSTHAHQH